MTSMAAALAASLPQVLPNAPKIDPLANVPTKVPQRMEGVVDAEALREVESLGISSLVFLKIMKHSTDILPNQHSAQTDLKAPPPTNLSSRPDAIGVLLGLDLDGVMEVEDCFALPGGESSFGGNSYSQRLLTQIREVQSPDSPIGIYLSTHNGGFVTRPAIEMMIAVEKYTGRGKAVLVVHDAAKSMGGDLSLKGWRLSEGGREAARGGKWDTPSLIEHKITSANMLTPLPINITSPSILTAFLKTLTTPTAQPPPSLKSPSVPLPPTFAPLINPLPTSLPSYLSDTLDSLTLHQHEANNVAFLMRQIAREKSRHEGSITERNDENIRRRKQNLPELPVIGPEVRGGTREPNRLDLLCLQGQVDGLAKGMGAEAGKGLVRCYL